MKPCQTGYPPADDAGFVAEACGSEPASTYLGRLEPALAPAVAAEVADEALSYEEIRSGVEAVIERMTDLPVWPVPPLDLSDPTAAVSGIREQLPAEPLPTE